MNIKKSWKSVRRLLEIYYRFTGADEVKNTCELVWRCCATTIALVAVPVLALLLVCAVPLALVDIKLPVWCIVSSVVTYIVLVYFAVATSALYLIIRIEGLNISPYLSAAEESLRRLYNHLHEVLCKPVTVDKE